ncbi:MAG: cobalt-precorrin-5B (C(1))-methyltransferase [Methanomicrobiales archaeon]|nr:cobalt-precorrin-5B (C(1))-methyltransferase [Methanomicrobiales archaeon]
MRDPVSGYQYPDAWVAQSAGSPHLPLVKSGLAVLTSSGIILRRGYTTGTTAAAAVKAAILSHKALVSEVSLTLPCGLIVQVPVTAQGGAATCMKFSGDYPGDATAGILIEADSRKGSDGLIIIAGEGIGRFSRETPRFSKGGPAISASATASIMAAGEDAIAALGWAGAEVRLSVPAGQEIGASTLNPRVGVIGGISLLGTTGLVEPWDGHYTRGVLERVRSAERVVLTTGRTGLRYSHLLFPDHEVVLVGRNLGEAIAAARGDVVICGLPGLVLKWIESDVLVGTGALTVEELSVTPQFSAVLSAVLERFVTQNPGVRVVVINRAGEVMGDTG